MTCNEAEVCSETHITAELEGADAGMSAAWVAGCRLIWGQWVAECPGGQTAEDTRLCS